MTVLDEYCGVLQSAVIESKGGVSRQDINGFLLECFRAMEDRSEDLFSDEMQSLRSYASEYVDYELTDDKGLLRAFAMGAIKAATRFCELCALSIDSQERAILQMRSLSLRDQELLTKAVGILKKQPVLTHNSLSNELGIDKSRLSQIFSAGKINRFFVIAQIGREKHYSLSSLGRDLYDGLQAERGRHFTGKPIKSRSAYYELINSFDVVMEIKSSQLRDSLFDRLEHSLIDPNEIALQIMKSSDRYSSEKFADSSSKINRAHNYFLSR